MALTPEDVVNKRFQPTKFREGYDQDEVDDFLDEIVVELRRLNQENDELRRKVSDLQSGGSGESAVPAPVSAEAAEDQDTQVKAGAAPEAVESTDTTESAQAEDTPAAAPATAAPAAGAAVPAAVSEPTVTESAPAAGSTAATPVSGASEATATSAAGVLAMAQKLHDDYVAEGQTKREEIILEAQTEANGLVNDAQEKSRKTLADLEEKKSVLERKVEQLKGFERDYRARLKAYIEGQLRDLQNQGPIQDEATASN
ncbi:DivIVA domain-containing protein [Citricoccus sp. K5]|uniref:DivIVA domain-containing protein n=1 Tax=Citricoccus sp. K5 TaxID=2653135 RepID=UPI0012EF9A64|nr:DivIVA domain-containing protein [Citricoccus sp. K5]VXB45658.1 DivIVA domain-containing protein [Citricoccus sp. K5]